MSRNTSGTSSTSSTYTLNDILQNIKSHEQAYWGGSGGMTGGITAGSTTLPQGPVAAGPTYVPLTPATVSPSTVTPAPTVSPSPPPAPPAGYPNCPTADSKTYCCSNGCFSGPSGRSSETCYPYQDQCVDVCKSQCDTALSNAFSKKHPVDGQDCMDQASNVCHSGAWELQNCKGDWYSVQLKGDTCSYGPKK
jgi:hypothetical protein